MPRKKDIDLASLFEENPRKRRRKKASPKRRRTTRRRTKRRNPPVKRRKRRSTAKANPELAVLKALGNPKGIKGHKAGTIVRMGTRGGWTVGEIASRAGVAPTTAKRVLKRFGLLGRVHHRKSRRGKKPGPKRKRKYTKRKATKRKGRKKKYTARGSTVPVIISTPRTRTRTRGRIALAKNPRTRLANVLTKSLWTFSGMALSRVVPSFLARQFGGVPMIGGWLQNKGIASGGLAALLTYLPQRFIPLRMIRNQQENLAVGAWCGTLLGVGEQFLPAVFQGAPFSQDSTLLVLPPSEGAGYFPEYPGQEEEIIEEVGYPQPDTQGDYVEEVGDYVEMGDYVEEVG